MHSLIHFFIADYRRNCNHMRSSIFKDTKLHLTMNFSGSNLITVFKPQHAFGSDILRLRIIDIVLDLPLAAAYFLLTILAELMQLHKCRICRFTSTKIKSLFRVDNASRKLIS